MNDEALASSGCPNPAPAAQHAPPIALTASDLRQYVYCARVIYFRYCVPVRPPPSYKMAEGKLQHAQVEDLERRRSLHAYGLTDGERAFDVRLASERLAISGTLDMVIVRRHEVIPVEFKHTEARPVTRARPALRAASTKAGSAREDANAAEHAAVSLHHKYQLAAYAMLAEEHWQLPAHRCFVYLVGARQALAVAITPSVRAYTRRLLREMRELIVSQRMPAATRHAGRCRDCEYRRFCNDVD